MIKKSLNSEIPKHPQRLDHSQCHLNFWEPWQCHTSMESAEWFTPTQNDGCRCCWQEFHDGQSLLLSPIIWISAACSSIRCVKSPYLRM